MTRAEREAIRARCEAATPGPWAVCDHPDSPIEKWSHVVPESHQSGEADVMGTRASCAFIAAARTDVPALLAEVDRLEAERDALRKAQAAWLASPEAAKRLEGYRELGAKCAALEAERDAAQRALAEAEERAERAGRERNELRIACGEEARKALEAQAREVALREALSSICGHVFNTTDVWHIAHDALLAVPADDAALREFGLRVVDECFRQAGASTLVDGISAIDAVLRGSR